MRLFIGGYTGLIIQKIFCLRKNIILKKITKMLAKLGEYRFFSTEQEICLWIEQNKNIVSSGNDAKQIEALEWYAGYWAEKINSWLRIGKVINCWDQNWGVQKVQQMIHQIEKVMQNTKLKENIITVRWVRINHFHYCFKDRFCNLKAGNSYTDNGFLSTSLLFSYCGDYDGGNRDLRKNMLLIIKVPINTVGFYNAANNRSEFEFIIEKGSQILIEKIYRLFFKPFIILCKIVPK
jgi:hypothetical protein